MKKFVLILSLISILSTCKQDDEVITKNIRVDLTRNIPYEKRWMFAYPILDSIDENNIPYYSLFPQNTSQGYRILFGLKSLNKENSVYLRITEFQDPNGPGFLYCSDTIQVQIWNSDSIICKIAAGSNNDTVGYYSFTFHGRYNFNTGNIEGFIVPQILSYRCPTCPGMVYRYYEGKVPAMFIPINY